MGPIPFANTYAQLPAAFYRRLAPTPVSKPGLIRTNDDLATRLGIAADWLASEEGVATVAGNLTPAGADPLAAAYAGHQFGSYNPQLGDGRALLLGEVVDTSGKRVDIQLKGSGPTPYSRGGDGRSPLGPVLREYIVSEAMFALGVPTTRALAAVSTGDPVMRETVLPGAVLARVASSHVRIGTFQFFAASGDRDALLQLVQYCLGRHYPQQANSATPALALLQAVIGAQAQLVARWQLLGFIHGVMNTDNMLICGETVDYGPCAFMDEFDPAKVFSSIDQGGRYAYRNQPGIAHWNLAVLAQALLPLLHEEQEQAVALAQEAVDTFPALFEAAHLRGLADKLGLTEVAEADKPLVDDLFQLMRDAQTDFTLTFRRLYDHANEPAAPVTDWFELPDSFIPWLSRWRARLAQDPLAPGTREQRMRQANPALIPRNHNIEAAIRAAEDRGDLAPFNAMVDHLTNPFVLSGAAAAYVSPPRPEEAVTRTFCGT